MHQWLKQQPLKRKKEPVQATATTESAETYTSDARGDTNDGDDNRKQRMTLLDSMTIVTYPLDLHGVEMKMNPNLNVSSAGNNVIFNSYSCTCISMTLFI